MPKNVTKVSRIPMPGQRPDCAHTMPKLRFTQDARGYLLLTWVLCGKMMDPREEVLLFSETLAISIPLATTSTTYYYYDYNA